MSDNIKAPKLRRCPHCRSTLVMVYDSRQLGANIGGNHVAVKCSNCGHYAPSVFYDSSYMRFAGYSSVKLNLRAAVEIAALRWNARTNSEYKRAEGKVKEYAKACVVQ